MDSLKENFFWLVQWYVNAGTMHRFVLVLQKDSKEEQANPIYPKTLIIHETKIMEDNLNIIHHYISSSLFYWMPPYYSSPVLFFNSMWPFASHCIPMCVYVCMCVRCGPDHASLFTSLCLYLFVFSLLFIDVKWILIQITIQSLSNEHPHCQILVQLQYIIHWGLTRLFSAVHIYIFTSWISRWFLFEAYDQNPYTLLHCV